MIKETFDIYDNDTAYKTCQYCDNLFTDIDEWDDEYDCCTYCVTELDWEMEVLDSDGEEKDDERAR